MTRQRIPRKPVPPLGHIAFSKNGSVRKVIEPLPDIQESLEATIMKKFAGALKHFEGRTLTNIRQMSLRPDYSAQERNIRWEIELTEVVDPSYAQKYAQQQKYETAVTDRLGGIPAFLNGIDVLICDNYQEPLFPSLRTSEGQSITHAVVDQLSALSNDLAKLPVEGTITADLTNKQNAVPRLTLFCSRFTSTAVQGQIHFSGFFPIDTEETHHLLERAILGKLGKDYQAHKGHRLMLLAYELRMISVMAHGTALDYAQRTLRSRQHPFDEVWYLHPYDQQDLGHLVGVWPVLGN